MLYDIGPVISILFIILIKILNKQKEDMLITIILCTSRHVHVYGDIFLEGTNSYGKCVI